MTEELEQKAEEYVKQKYPTLEIKAVFIRYVEMYIAGATEATKELQD